MGRNLYNIYTSNPGNYIVSGAGGIGKTTQLLNIMHKMIQNGTQDKEGRTYVPVYIRIKDLNTRRIGAEVLYDVIADFFNHTVNKRAINEMFENSMQTHCFLIMLDGLNELNNYMAGNQSALIHIANDIISMNKYANVHFIITWRNKIINNMVPENDIEKELQSHGFSTLKIEGLTKSQIDVYLGERVLTPESHLRDILTVPMLTRAFKEVYSQNPERAAALNTKYELMKEWLILDTIYKTDERIDIEDMYRHRVVEEVLPLFAFKVELEMLQFDSPEPGTEATQAIQYDNILGETLNALEMTGDYKQHILDTIDRTSLLIENNRTFTHDLIREYLAAYCLLNNTDKVSKEDVQLMFKRLICFFSDDDNNDINKIKQKLYLDFGELIYGATQDGMSLVDLLSQYGFDECKMNETAYCFFFRLAGIFEGLSERKLAYRIGWKAIELFQKVGNNKSDYDKGFEYNWLYYCVNKYKEDNEHDPYPLIEKAKNSLEKITAANRPQDYDALYAMILSNTGSHYVSPYCRNPDEAIKWHSKCLEYRKNMDPMPSLVGTYRTLMTDCYYSGVNGNKEGFLEAYKYYREAIKSTLHVDAEGVPINRLSQIDDRADIPMDIVLRAMGSEILILKINGNFDDVKELKQEIIEELPCQIEHVYTNATTGRRHNYDALRDLIGKLDDLSKWNEIGEHLELKTCIEEYMNKEL